MVETRHFTAAATPNGVLEVEGSVTDKEVAALRDAWADLHGEWSIRTLVAKQRKAIFFLQARLIVDAESRPSGQGRSGELKDLSLALAAAIDKLYVLNQIEHGHLGP